MRVAGRDAGRGGGPGELHPRRCLSRGCLAAGANVMVLDPDVAKVFPTSESVNDALRALASIIRSVPTRRRGGKKSA